MIKFEAPTPLGSWGRSQQNGVAIVQRLQTQLHSDQPDVSKLRRAGVHLVVVPLEAPHSFAED